MRFFSQSILSSCALVLGLGLLACGGNPEATPEASGSASAPKKAPSAVAPKRIDPLVMKTYRADACYFGALSLVQARAAYNGSLAGGEPGEGKIPEFGLDAAPTPPTKDAPAPAPVASASAAPSAKAPAPTKPAPTTAAKTGSAKPAAAPSAATPAPATSGSAGLRPAPDPKLAQNFRSLPYERFIRSCNVAAGLKEPSAPEFDAAVKEFADYALPLSKALQDANAYYQKGTQKDDGFAKGKELHKTITEGFGKLDAQLTKLKTATETWEKANPVNKSDNEEGQKLADKVVADSNAVVAAFAEGDFAKAKAAVTAVEASSAALKKYGEDNKDKKDPWATLLPPQTTGFLEQAKQLSEKEAKDVTPAKIVNLITLHSRILETNHRALTRKNAGDGRAPGVTPNPRNLKPKLPANHPE